VKDTNHFTFKHVTLTWKSRSYHLLEIVSEISEVFFF